MGITRERPKTEHHLRVKARENQHNYLIGSLALSWAFPCVGLQQGIGGNLCISQYLGKKYWHIDGSLYLYNI